MPKSNAAHEKKVKTGYKPTEVELSSAIGEYLKNVSLSKAYSKTVIDLTGDRNGGGERPSGDRQSGDRPKWNPKRPIGAYSAQDGRKVATKRFFQGVVTKDAKEEYELKGGRKVLYIAVKTANEVCTKCQIDREPNSWCKPNRCYCRKCEICGLFGHSTIYCMQKV